uniref:Beta-lactamase-related domain-containing protein n=1 Tax=Moniliophthora roreri TaxID=221103 RepID=A0A0W0EUZ0_MONRR
MAKCAYLTTLLGFARAATDVLRIGTPESVFLPAQPFKELERNISEYLVARNYGTATHGEVRPIYPGATVLVGYQGTVISYFAVGDTLKYGDANGTELPEEARVKATKETIWDMASLTKMFTTILVLQQIERGAIELNKTVKTYVPEFADQTANGKENVTILQLLTHTSGLPPSPVPPLWIAYSNITARREAIIQQPLDNIPGEVYLYSDLNFMILQIVLERVTGKPLDDLLRDDFTGPLGMNDTYYNRGNREDSNRRVAATEFQIAVQGDNEPQRPQPVRGTVHDEKAWSIDGVSGHAGVFSTAWDLAVFCQMILNNGTYGGKTILQPESVDQIFTNYNARFPNDAHGLGFELNQSYWAGPMASLQTAGHTGFTGTSMVIDRPSQTFFILLTNRVHPSRNWSSPNVVRQMLGYWVHEALDQRNSSVSRP